MMAWLALRTDEEDGATIFRLSVNADPLTAEFHSVLKDVQQSGNSVFGNEEWRDIAGRMARDIDRSVGSEFFRNCWAEAVDGLTARKWPPI
jgi:hypothetical protein